MTEQQKAVASVRKKFAQVNGIWYRDTGEPVAMCPQCGLPSSVISTTGIIRRHKCAGYCNGNPDKAVVGCGAAFKTVNWKQAAL